MSLFLHLDASLPVEAGALMATFQTGPHRDNPGVDPDCAAGSLRGPFEIR